MNPDDPGELDYEFNEKLNLVVAKATGAIQIQQAMLFFDGLAADSNYLKHNILLDMRQGSTSFTTGEHRNLVSYTSKYTDQFDDVQMAAIVSNDVDYGLMRMADMLADGAGINVVPFRSRTEAIEWLNHG